jgi:hypothetical protein
MGEASGKCGRSLPAAVPRMLSLLRRRFKRQSKGLTPVKQTEGQWRIRKSIKNKNKKNKK